MAKERTTDALVSELREKLVAQREYHATELARITEILSVVRDRVGHEGERATVREEEDIVPKVTHHLTKAARARLSANMKKRWAERKAKGVTSLKAGAKPKKAH